MVGRADKSGVTHYFNILQHSKILPLFFLWGGGLCVGGGGRGDGGGKVIML